uniref:Uncharacterized protein n=1 Tax=Glossina brevipalpis TaxID=37001 RepID=A0A1A9WQJ6_9MUSC
MFPGTTISVTISLFNIIHFKNNAISSPEFRCPFCKDLSVTGIIDRNSCRGFYVSTFIFFCIFAAVAASTLNISRRHIFYILSSVPISSSEAARIFNNENALWLYMIFDLKLFTRRMLYVSALVFKCLQRLLEITSALHLAMKFKALRLRFVDKIRFMNMKI